MAPGEPHDLVRGPNLRRLLVLGFAIVGVVHVVVASRGTQIVEVPLTAELGLLQLLPPGAWIGLGLLGFALALAVRDGHAPLIVVTGALLLATFASVPTLFEPNPRYWDAYLHFSEAQTVIATGHVPPADLGQYSANWPGTFLFVAILTVEGAVPPLVVLALFPAVTAALTFLAMFVFLRATFGGETAAIGAPLSSLFAVWAQYHLSPQSLGFILLLLVLALVWRRERRWRIVSALLFGGLVVSHPTSTIILLCILVGACVLGVLRQWRRRERSPDESSLRKVTVAYGTTWLAWLFLQATGSSRAAESAILTLMASILQAPEQTLNIATARTVQNVFTWAPLLRTGSLAVFGLLGFASLVLLYRRGNNPSLARFLTATIGGIGVLAVSDIVGFQGGQFYDRCLLAFATIAPALCLTGLRTVRLSQASRRLVVLVLVGASVAAASTTYYQEAFNLVPDESVATANFLNRPPDGATVLDGQYPVAIWIPPEDRAFVSRVPFTEIDPAPLAAFGPGAYAVFDPTAELWYLQWRGIDLYRSYEADRANHARIYDNGQGVVYFIGG